MHLNAIKNTLEMACKRYSYEIQNVSFGVLIRIETKSILIKKHLRLFQ